ncbi:RING-H2 finger protein ATL74-like [Humulus lupulus]|uniref:RING-H2 finger protein ATL74-like n=1 Tax=Humulus lupulus TaxID=3486 RepID=UPI002B401610|nr:RING-H2 finger protein ATL74-like [Humulus lupulus]
MVTQHHHNPYHRPYRLVLQDSPESNSPPPAAANENRSNLTRGSYVSEANFDTNMVIILAALLCALICALGLNSIVRCAMRCSRRFAFETADEAAARLAATGLKKSALRKIPVAAYGISSGIKIIDTDCTICLGEFETGDKVRVLPKCCHGFHVRCIDPWLVSHSSCPTCRRSLLEQTASSDAAPAAEADAGIRHHGNAAGPGVGQGEVTINVDEVS